MRQVRWLVCLLSLLCVTIELPAQQPKPVIPHAQDKPPNDPRDPATAAKMMTVPEGFSVEVVAAEPDIVNPVAMAIDERGRFWITESLEYPRREPGPGKDRVKILEDTDGDGKMDKFTVFLDGLNIPSGIAVGHGGVWIANSPDILFVPDADRDGKPDGPAQVVVTGFGRADTHELPNSLTWGPDGWLYGLNGVFNYSHVTYPKDSPWLKRGQGVRAEGQGTEKGGGARGEGQGTKGDAQKDAGSNDQPSVAQPSALSPKPTSAPRPSALAPQPPTEFKFTCAMFRIHPRTREFQVFCEGTSNPWGIAFNDEGEAFVSACVIDHLWHLVETGYYHRQGGPYPPFTWKIDSIVKHKHQKAAYCGIHYFDSDAYPEQYRGKLYMGNIHGGCINVDRIERDGSTYKGFGEPDFLTANDAWFMPVVQKTGPDGCLYILDWYDRYHCYQDANRDPAGIDRLKGRLYRVRYKDSPRTPKGFDLAKETDEQLIDRLGAKNDFIRWTAMRLLTERATLGVRKGLVRGAASDNLKSPGHRYAIFTLFAIHHLSNDVEMIFSDLDLTIKPDSPRPIDPAMVAMYARFQGDNPACRQAFVDGLLLSGETFFEDWAHAPPEAPQVCLQQIITFAKLPIPRSLLIDALVYYLARSGDDKILPRVIWANLHPHLEDHAAEFVRLVGTKDYLNARPVADLMPRVADRILGRQKFDAKPVAQLFSLLRDDHSQVGRQVLEVISAKVQSGELKGEKLDQLKAAMAEPMTALLADQATHPLASDAALLAASWGDQRGLPQVRRSFTTRGVQADLRLKSLNALISAKDDGVLSAVSDVLADKDQSAEFKSQVLLAIARLEDAKVSDVILEKFAAMEPSLQPSAIELLTQRASWSKRLLTQVGEKKIAATAINLNQARRIQALKDKDLSELLNRHWGQVRDTRNPDREKVVAEMKSLIRNEKTPGDPFAGEKVFKRVCAACHKIYGEGPDIGPDITLNGRNDFTQLLSNVFDPSLVIGAGYRVCTVVTTSGRVQSGLLVEDSPQRVVLKPAAVGRPGDDATKLIDGAVQVSVGKLEIIPRDEIDEFKLNELSLMPEGLEKQLTPQEIIDLFAFITLDKHPKDPSAKRLPGVSAVSPRNSLNPGDFAAMVGEILPGFSTSESGELGIGLLTEHLGRENVLRTHPVTRDKPCVLSTKLTPPADKKTKLILDIAHDARGDWRLVVRGNGQRMADEMISKETCSKGWRTLTIDLTKFAGQELKLDLVNQANDWSNEFGYWSGARIESE